MSRQRLTKLYMLLVIGGGIPVIVYSVLRLPLEQIDLQFLALAILAIGISSRLTVRIPRVSGHISVSDTFQFLTIDRKSTRLNSSHSQISYAVFCLKKKKKNADFEINLRQTFECLLDHL